MKNHRYTAEQIEFIREVALGKSIDEILVLFNRKFDTTVTFKSIKGIMYRNNIKTGMQGYKTRFIKGQEAWNKGVKGLQLGGEKGWFKKGIIPPTTLPTGTERVNENDFVIVKTAQPNEWRLKHHVIYEKYYGDIPNGYKVIFADKNKRNFDINNLILLSPEEFTAAMKRNLLFDNTEATKSGVLLAKYLMTVNKKMKEVE